MKPVPTELEDWAEFVASRLKLARLACAEDTSAANGGERIGKKRLQGQRKLREARKKRDYRQSFSLETAPRKLATPYALRPENRKSAEAGSALEDGVKEISVGQEVLKRRLKAKIQAVREETGVARAQKKSLQQRNAARDARKQKKLRRQRAQKRQESAAQSVAFSSLTQSDAEPRRRTPRLLKKFKQLRKAQTEQERTERFTQSGEGGEKVMKTEWERAMRRAAGEKVLDDPKRLQKSIDDAFKQKAKRAKKWQQRSETERQAQEERQSRRRHNSQRRAAARRKNRE